MKQLFQVLALFLFSFNIIAQKEDSEITLSTSTKEVTVYLQGAQIFREGKTNLRKGIHILQVKSLSALLDPNSITVKGKGDIKILSVQHQFDFLEKEINTERVDSLQNIIESVEISLRKKNNRIAVLNEKENLIGSNKNLGNESISSNQLLQMLNLYEKELSSIKIEQSDLIIEINDLNNRLVKLRSQLNAIDRDQTERKSNILIKLEANQTTNSSFQISYFVSGAGWYPKYRLNVQDISQPIELEYQAEVYQQTGEDWNDVELRFSNAEPNKNKEAPELRTWYLDYARYTNFEESNLDNLRTSNAVKGKVIDAETGDPLPGVNILVTGTSIGTITDLQGNYSITMPQDADQLSFTYIGMKTKTMPVTSSIVNVGLRTDSQQVSEVVVTGYAAEELKARNKVRIRGTAAIRDQAQADRTSSTIIKRQTNVEFEVDESYSIKSGSPQIYIDLKEYKIDASFRYVAVPKLDKNAYLVAGITNWDDFNLMQGEAKLFFEGSFVGTSILNANTAIDTLKFSLGNDKGIIVERNKIDDFNTRKFIGVNKMKQLGYEIKVRNSKSQPVELVLYDQVPVSVRDNIEVELKESTQAKYNQKTGELKWKLILSANSNVKKSFIYEVKYPKDEEVILD